MFGSRVISSGHRKLFHDQMNVRMTLVAMAGFDSGSSTRTMIRHSVSPSIRAASTSDFGTASNADLKTKMQTIVESIGNARPRYVFSRPIRAVIRYAGMIVA